MSKVPKLRFEGFTEEWEHSKLGQHCDMYNGDRSSKYPNDSDLVPKGIPFINAGDLVDGRVNLVSAKKITREKYNDLGGAKIKKGDIVYCLRGTLGKNAYIDNFDEGTVASSLVCIRPKDIIGRFLYYVLNSNIEYTQRIICDEGAAQPNLSAKSVSNYSIPFPCVREQEQIGILLDSLYTLLTLHQRKLDALQKAKKFYLQNLFPRKGEKTPRLRFEGFSGEWEEKKLGDVASIIGGNAWKSSEYSDSGAFLVVTIANVSGDLNVNDSVGNHIDCDSSSPYILSNGDILVSLTGNVGRVSKMTNTRAVLNQRVGKIVPNNEIFCEFLFQILWTSSFESAMIIAGQGAAQKNISNSDVLSYEFYSPKEIKEQQRIGGFLSNLDRLITTQQRKLETLKRLKQFMLQNLFV